MTSIVNSVVYCAGKRIADIAINDIGEAIRQACTHSCGLACTSRTTRSCSGSSKSSACVNWPSRPPPRWGYQVARTYDDAAMFGLV